MLILTRRRLPTACQQRCARRGAAKTNMPPQSALRVPILREPALVGARCKFAKPMRKSCCIQVSIPDFASYDSGRGPSHPVQCLGESMRGRDHKAQYRRHLTHARIHARAHAHSMPDPRCPKARTAGTSHPQHARDMHAQSHNASNRYWAALQRQSARRVYTEVPGCDMVVLAHPDVSPLQQPSPRQSAVVLHGAAGGSGLTGGMKQMGTPSAHPFGAHTKSAHMELALPL
jgi:hypothetical protein